MEIRVLEDKKLVEVWLTNKEKEDVQIVDYPKGIYGVYRAKKYRVATFLSGSENLWDNTVGLLQHNRQCTAKRELLEER